MNVDNSVSPEKSSSSTIATTTSTNSSSSPKKPMNSFIPFKRETFSEEDKSRISALLEKPLTAADVKTRTAGGGMLIVFQIFLF